MKHLVVAVLAAAFSSSCAAADAWTLVRSDHFELYTTANADLGRSAVAFFERVHDVFAGWNAKEARPGYRVRIIVFQSEKEYRFYQPNRLVVAFFSAGPGGEFIVMKDFSPETYPVAVHEYVHLIVNHSGLKLTTAMNEGLAEFYSTLKITPEGIEIGNPPEARLMGLHRGSLIPLASLLAVQSPTAAYPKEQQVQLFYAESWALTHMLLLSPEYRSKTASYARAMQAGPDPVAALERITGKTSSQIQADLARYLRNTRFVTAQLDAKPAREELFEVRSATRRESGMALAGLLDSMGRHDEAVIRYRELAASDAEAAK